VIAGVDISSFQHPNGAKIDYAKAIANAVDFAIIRYRDEEGKEDPTYEEDVAGFREHGAYVGSYCYLRPDLPMNPQAADLRKLASNGPVWGDLEITGGLSAEKLREWWQALVDACPHIGLVTYPAFLAAYGVARTPPLWIDSFGAKEAPAGALIWGTSDKASVPGIPAPVDLDHWTGTRAQLAATFAGDAQASGKDPTAKRAPAPTPDIVAIAGMPAGDGYVIASKTGGVFAFGNATYHGNPDNLTNPVVDIALTASGRGYHIVTSNGTVHSYGDARPEAAVPS
jgi:hypothetical protein